MISQLLCRFRFGVDRALGGRRAADGAVSERAPLEVCPPALGRLAAPAAAGLRAWFGARWRDSTSVSTIATPHRTQHRPARPAAPLSAVRAEFTEALVGEKAPAAAALLGRILPARSLRELWHLRAEVYTVVARLHGEAEAQQRLRRLDRHFATRSASGRPARDRHPAF